jgi:uncharacterized protein
MPKLLVHITCGPENPTKSALGFLVARTALSEGHEVSLFLAGDGVQLMRDSVLDSLVGLGTGSLREHFDAIVAAKGQIYVSGKSSQGRGVTARDLEGKPATMAMPDKLVALALAANATITY